MNEYYIMKMDNEEARDVVCGDHPDWEEVSSHITDLRRWSVHRIGVFKHNKTGYFYQVSWSAGATEQQTEVPFEYETTVNFKKVIPIKKMKTVWIEAKDEQE